VGRAGKRVKRSLPCALVFRQVSGRSDNLGVLFWRRRATGVSSVPPPTATVPSFARRSRGCCGFGRSSRVSRGGHQDRRPNRTRGAGRSIAGRGADSSGLLGMRLVKGNDPA
jgi:hypothetical protein